eukprot:3941864-Rhodomonas_salina.1
MLYPAAVVPVLYFPANGAMQFPHHNALFDPTDPQMSVQLPFANCQHPQQAFPSQNFAPTIKPCDKPDPGTHLHHHLHLANEACLEILAELEPATLKTPLSKRMKNRHYYETHKKEINTKRAQKKKEERMHKPPVPPTRGQLGKKCRNSNWYAQHKEKILAQQAVYRRRVKIAKVQMKRPEARGTVERVLARQKYQAASAEQRHDPVDVQYDCSEPSEQATHLTGPEVPLQGLVKPRPIRLTLLNPFDPGPLVLPFELASHAGLQ